MLFQHKHFQCKNNAKSRYSHKKVLISCRTKPVILIEAYLFINSIQLERPGPIIQINELTDLLLITHRTYYNKNKYYIKQ